MSAVKFWIDTRHKLIIYGYTIAKVTTDKLPSLVLVNIAIQLRDFASKFHIKPQQKIETRESEETTDGYVVLKSCLCSPLVLAAYTTRNSYKYPDILTWHWNDELM